MEDRRVFLKTLAATLAASRSVFGANDRVQMGVIGTGTRGNQVYQSFMRNKDVTFVTACDVQKSRVDKFVADSKTKMTTVGDYRRVLDNKDVDAVLLTTPDHWHSPMVIEALQAGKDIYCEKPVSNTLDAAIKMRDACRTSKRIVQVGCQQRSWQHFQDQAKRVKGGYIGTINQCVLLFPGFSGFGPPPQEKPQAPPPDLDWEMFQGPAARHPFVPSRLNWRGYWDYGGGSITDWGVHLTDVMLWYMNADAKGPLLASASYVYTSGHEDPEQAPDTFSVTWKYDGFVATFANATPPGSPGLMMSDTYGNWFYGQKAVALVNRYGFEVKPVAQLEMGGSAGAAPADHGAVIRAGRAGHGSAGDLGEPRLQVRIGDRPAHPQLPGLREVTQQQGPGVPDGRRLQLHAADAAGRHVRPAEEDVRVGREGGPARVGF